MKQSRNLLNHMMNTNLKKLVSVRHLVSILFLGAGIIVSSQLLLAPKEASAAMACHANAWPEFTVTVYNDATNQVITTVSTENTPDPPYPNTKDVFESIDVPSNTRLRFNIDADTEPSSTGEVGYSAGHIFYRTGNPNPHPYGGSTFILGGTNLGTSMVLVADNPISVEEFFNVWTRQYCIPSAEYPIRPITNFDVLVTPQGGTPTVSCSASPNPVTINQGETAAFSIVTEGQNGFNSNVNFTADISGTGTRPVVGVDTATNNRPPPGPTLATATASASTTPGTYVITFTGTGGGDTTECSVLLTVNGPDPDFTLTIQPPYSHNDPPNGQYPNETMLGNNYSFTVFVTCTGGYTGPIVDLHAYNELEGGTIVFSSTGTNTLSQLACGASAPLVADTSRVQPDSLSTPQAIILRNITVTGQGEL